jgi:hypothetical protein
LRRQIPAHLGCKIEFLRFGLGQESGNKDIYDDHMTKLEKRLKVHNEVEIKFMDLKKYMKTIFLIATTLLLILPIKADSSDFKAYEVVDVKLSKVLITDGFDYYFVNYGIGCYYSDFYKGDIIFIDTFLYPIYGDTILVTDSLYGTTTCDVISSENLYFKSYTVEMDTGYEILIKDSYSNYFLVDYI